MWRRIQIVALLAALSFLEVSAAQSSQDLLIQDSTVAVTGVNSVFSALAGALANHSESEVRALLDRDLLVQIDPRYTILNDDMIGDRTPSRFELLTIGVFVPTGGLKVRIWVLRCVVRIIRNNQEAEYAVVAVIRRGDRLFLRTIPNGNPVLEEFWDYTEVSMAESEGTTRRDE